MCVLMCVIGLCRNINPSLPQQERLEKLIEASMKVQNHDSSVVLKITLYETKTLLRPECTKTSL